MPTTVETNMRREPWRIPYWLGLCVFLGRHAQIRDRAFGVLALIEKWGADARSSSERWTQRWKRGVRGRILKGEDASSRRTV